MATLIKASNKTTKKALKYLSNSEYILTFEGTLDDYCKIEEEKVDYLRGGIIVMQSPASVEHERIFRNILTQFHNYVIKNNFGEVLGSRFAIAFNNDFRFKPDVVFISKDNKGIFAEYEFSGIPVKTTHSKDINDALNKISSEYLELKLGALQVIIEGFQEK